MEAPVYVICKSLGRAWFLLPKDYQHNMDALPCDKAGMALKVGMAL